MTKINIAFIFFIISLHTHASAFLENNGNELQRDAANPIFECTEILEEALNMLLNNFKIQYTSATNSCVMIGALGGTILINTIQNRTLNNIASNTNH